MRLLKHFKSEMLFLTYGDVPVKKSRHKIIFFRKCRLAYGVCTNEKSARIILNLFVAGAILIMEGDKENGE